MEKLKDITERVTKDLRLPPSPRQSGTLTATTPTEKSLPSDACPTCLDAGWIYAVSKCIPNDKERLVGCPECTNWLKRSRLTAEEQQHTLDHIGERADDTRGEMVALRFLGKQMLEDPYGFLSIWGKKGGGKSLLLTALVASFCRLKRPAVYFNASEVVTMLAPREDASMGGEFRGDMEARKRQLKDTPVLAIDEVDKIRWTPWEVQQIGEVIEHRHRYAECRVTLLAMNNPPWEWSNAAAVEHIASRLSDGRFYRQWPDDKLKWLPACAGANPELPGLFEVTLPDIRPTLRRY